LEKKIVTETHHMDMGDDEECVMMVEARQP
jgi:hypothetical protein